MFNLNYIIMKKFKIFVLALVLFAMNASAAVIDPVTPSAKLRAEIIELLGTDCPFQYDSETCTAEVLFTINSNSEIVVILVTSKNPDADLYIKDKINYEKVNHKIVKQGELFLLPVRIVKS